MWAFMNWTLRRNKNFYRRDSEFTGVASKVSSLRFAVGWEAFLNRSAREGRWGGLINSIAISTIKLLNYIQESGQHIIIIAGSLMYIKIIESEVAKLSSANTSRTRATSYDVWSTRMMCYIACRTRNKSILNDLAKGLKLSPNSQYKISHRTLHPLKKHLCKLLWIKFLLSNHSLRFQD